MARYYVSEMIDKTQNELKDITRGLKNGKLYFGEVVICENKDISKLYVAVLSYLAIKKEVNIKKGLDNTCNDTGEAINKTSVMSKIEGTNLYVDTKSNNDTKYKKMLKCFELLKEKEDISSYAFELDTDVDIKSQSEGDKSMGNNQMVESIIKKAVDNNKQVIFTGAPGTGKTWAVRKYVMDKVGGDENRYKFVQFHSSYDYTDFVEGLRPVPDGKGGNMFVRMDGIFKAFCRYIVEQNINTLKDKNGNKRFNSIDDYYNAMKNESEKEGFEREESVREDIEKELDETPYYMIIDEINRGDLSKIFGELMFGLEESYREVHNRFDTQYKNLPTYHMVKNLTGQDVAKEIADDCFKNGFFVPSNLYIIGTMNDIDRSVESFDFALRRRFIWIDIKANEIMETSLKSMRENYNNRTLSDEIIEQAKERIIAMNKSISGANMGLTDAYHIGPAYFKELVKVSDSYVEDALKGIFENRIEPILREYTRGRKNGVEELISGCKAALRIK